MEIDRLGDGDSAENVIRKKKKKKIALKMWASTTHCPRGEVTADQVTDRAGQPILEAN